MKLTLTSLVKRFQIYVTDAPNWFSRLEQCFTCRKPQQGMFNGALISVNRLNISSVSCKEKEINDFEKSFKITFGTFEGEIPELETYIYIFITRNTRISFHKAHLYRNLYAIFSHVKKAYTANENGVQLFSHVEVLV